MGCMLDFRKVEELKKYKFIVDFYQRGYRWSADDAESLAIDIADYDGNYFLQPLVVKKLDDNIYELVDGQQRLTTLNLIMKTVCGAEGVQIEYKRNDGLESGENKVDNLFREAVATKLNDLMADQKEKLRKKISGVYFVFYDIGEADGYSIFNTINAGRIPLADNELIKALILFRMKKDSDWKANDRQEEKHFLSIWNRALNHITNDEFYGFVLGRKYREKGQQYSNKRLDVLLSEMLPNKNNSNAYPIYKAFEKYIDFANQDHIRTFIAEFDKFDNLLYSAFLEDTVYHYVGAVLSLRGGRYFLEDIFFKYDDSSGLRKCKELPGRREFICEMKNMIREILKGHGIPSDSCKTEIKTIIEEWKKSESVRVRDLLLLHNIFIEQRRGKRFSFYSFFNERWEIEHINPDTDNSDDDDFINSLYLYLIQDGNPKDPIDEKKKRIAEEYRKEVDMMEKMFGIRFQGHVDEMENLKKQALKYYFNEYVTEYPNEEKQKLWNLVLLDKPTNASIQNDFYLQKRKSIMEHEKEGRYILPATAYAFMKAYSPSLSHPFQWNEERDGDPYLDNIVDVIFDDIYKE